MCLHFCKDHYSLEYGLGFIEIQKLMGATVLTLHSFR